MKLTIKTDALREALNHVGLSASDQRSTIPVLGCVKLEGGWANLILTCTNLDILISDKVNATIQKEGMCCVNHRMLKQFVARATSPEIRMELKDKLLIVAHGENEGRFETLPVEEFPPANEIKSEPLKSNSEDLIGPLKMVRHAICQDESRYNLRGINIHRNEKFTEFAAVDGRRLAICRSSLPFGENDVIVPEITIRAAVELIQKDEISIKVSENMIEIQNGNLLIQSRLLEGKFPKYEHLVPKARENGLSSQRKELISAIQTAAIFLGQNEVSIQLCGKGKELKVECRNRFETKLFGTDLKGQAQVEKSVNYQLLLDALAVLEKDEVTIETDTESDDLVIREGRFLEKIMCINPASVVSKAKVEEKEQVPF